MNSIQRLLSRRWLLAALILGLTLAGFILTGQVPSQIDKPSGNPFLSQNGCPTPCWLGIKPGVSRSADVMKVLAANNLEQHARIQSLEGKVAYGDTTNASMIYWLDPRIDGTNFVVLRNDLVTEVNIGVYFKLNLGDVVNELGPPEYTIAYDTGTEPYIAVFIAYWPSKGFVMVSESPRDRRIKLDPLLTPTAIYYFQPTTIEKMTDLLYLYVYCSYPTTRENWLPWKGYIEIEVLPPRFGCR